MTETIQQLKRRIARMRESAERAEGADYHREMQAVQALETQAREMENRLPLMREEKPSKPPKNSRHCELAKIHLLKKQGCLDDDSYRDMLSNLTGQRSAAKLNRSQRQKVIHYLARYSQDFPDRPHNTETTAQLKKIEALLADQRLPWSYAVNIAKRMYQRQRLEWCSSDQLRSVITALVKRTEKARES